MKVLSRDLYARLRESLSPSLKADGFKRLKGSTLGWTRPSAQGMTNLWFQCDRYGWDNALGSSFTLEYRVAAGASAAPGSIKSLQRFPTLLSVEELETARHINNDVLKVLPEIGPGHPYNALPAEYLEAVMRKYRPQDEPYNPNLDPWMHFYTLGHLDRWAEFLAPLVVPMTERFERFDEGTIGHGEIGVVV
jgi:hypothetical protein